MARIQLLAPVPRDCPAQLLAARSIPGRRNYIVCLLLKYFQNYKKLDVRFAAYIFLRRSPRLRLRWDGTHYRVDITAMLREDEYLASDWLMEVNLACLLVDNMIIRD